MPTPIFWHKKDENPDTGDTGHGYPPHHSSTMSGLLFDWDPVTGTKETFHYHGDGKFTIETTVDVEDIVERNKAIHAMTDERARFGGDGLGPQVAEIPLVIYYDLIQKGILDHEGNGGKAFKHWLNDSENRFFRTRPGRI